MHRYISLCAKEGNRSYITLGCTIATGQSLHNFDFTERPDGSVSSEDSHSDVVTASFGASTTEGANCSAICRMFSRRQLTPLEVAVERAGVERLLLHVDVNLDNINYRYINK